MVLCENHDSSDCNDCPLNRYQWAVQCLYSDDWNVEKSSFKQQHALRPEYATRRRGEADAPLCAYRWQWLCRAADENVFTPPSPAVSCSYCLQPPALENFLDADERAVEFFVRTGVCPRCAAVHHINRHHSSFKRNRREVAGEFPY